MAKNNENEKTKIIKNLQDRKDVAIAYFNATNNAIEMVKLLSQKADDLNAWHRATKKEIKYWQKFFLKQHGEYRNSVTEKIGAKLQVGTAIEKLKATKTIEELKSAWVSLTQDERQDPEISEVCKSLKEKYETIQRN